MNFFYGSYGFDILSIFLIFVSMFLNFGTYTRILGGILFLLVVLRTFSKNIYKRTLELNKFISIINSILGKFGKKLPNYPRISLDVYAQAFRIIKYKVKNYRDQQKKYKIVKCPKCKQKLRLPRGKGKLIVTCKKCNDEFKSKT